MAVQQHSVQKAVCVEYFYSYFLLYFLVNNCCQYAVNYEGQQQDLFETCGYVNIKKTEPVSEYKFLRVSYSSDYRSPFKKLKLYWLD